MLVNQLHPGDRSGGWNRYHLDVNALISKRFDRAIERDLGEAEQCIDGDLSPGRESDREDDFARPKVFRYATPVRLLSDQLGEAFASVGLVSQGVCRSGALGEEMAER